MAQLMFPNIAGDVNQGFDRGRQMRFNQLAGQAIADPSQSSALLGQAASINPGAALGIEGALASRAQQQQTFQQSQQNAQLKKIGGAARYMLAAVQTKDPAQIEGAYQAVRPYLAELGQAQGKTPPPQWDPAMEPALYHVIAATANAFPDDNKMQVVTPGATVLRGGTPIYSNPSAPKIEAGYAVSQGPNGALVAAPIPIAGASAPAQAPSPQASGVEFQFAPGTPQAVIDATKAAAAASGDGGQAPIVGQPQTLADATRKAKGPSALDQKIALARTMGATPDQIKAMVLGQTADPGQSGMNLLTDDGKALMDAAIAHGYNMPMPSMGYGKAGTAAKADAINSLAERFKGAGISPDAAVSQMMQGNTAISGLRSLQNVNAKIMGWESSASKQADIALNMSNQVDRTGIPLFNAWILGGRQATGSKEVAQFNNTVDTLAEEYARVMSGGNSAATDSTRALAHKMLNSAMTQEQFAGVVAKMRQEMTARTQALGEAVNAQRGAATSNDGSYSSAWPGQVPQAAPATQQPSDIDALLQKYGAH